MDSGANRLTVDLILMLGQIHEKAYEHNIYLYNLYTDYQRALDSMNRTQMIKDHVVLGIPSKLVRLTVRVNNELTCSFDINSSFRQTDELSTPLLNLTLGAAIIGIGIKSTQLCVKLTTW